MWHAGWRAIVMRSQMMMSPMLSPIRADTIDEVSSPEHGGVAALVEVASLDHAIGTISSGDDETDRRLTQQVISAPVTLTWPSPNGRIARSISKQIDSSPAAQEFEDEMLRHDDGECKKATEVAAAVSIQASFRGTRARAHAQQRRRERVTERAREQVPQPRSTRRQLKFDDRAPMDAGGVPRMAQERQNPFVDRLPPLLAQSRCCRAVFFSGCKCCSNALATHRLFPFCN